MLAWLSLSLLFSPSTQQRKTSEWFQWGFSSPLVAQGSKSVADWSMLLLFEEQQLSLATSLCLISGSFPGGPAWQTSSAKDAGRKQKGSQEIWSGTCSYGALPTEEQLPPLKAAQSSKQKQPRKPRFLPESLIVPSLTLCPASARLNTSYVHPVSILILYYPSTAIVPAALCRWGSFSMLRGLCTSISHEAQCLLMEQRALKSGTGHSRSLRKNV